MGDIQEEISQWEKDLRDDSEASIEKLSKVKEWVQGFTRSEA